MKNIQEWLGHANFNTTADIYSHLDFSSKLQSASVISSALKEDKEENNEYESLDDEIEELEKKLKEKHRFKKKQEAEM